MTFLITFAMRFVGPKLAAPLVYGVLILLAAGALFGIKSCYDNSVIERARVEGNAKALKEKADADANAAERRGQDGARAATEAEQLKETVDEAVSQGRDPRAAYYECVRLQQRAREAGRPAPAC